MSWLKRWRRSVTDPAAGLLVSSMVHGAGALSEPLRRRLGNLVSGVLWRLSRERRRVVLANLAVAFPEQDPAAHRALGREAMRHLAWNALEFAHLLHSPGKALRQVRLDPVFESLRGDGKAPPAMLVSPHLGSWELLGHIASLNGIPAAAVAHDVRNPYVRRLLQGARTAHGLQVIPSQGAVRGIVRAVREGRHIGLLMDQNTRLREGGAYVEFFGLPVTVTRAPAVLSRRLGLAVCAVACVRTAEGFAVVSEPLPRPAADYADDQDLLQAIMAANEALIRRFPEQYVWTYRRWRYIPSDAPEAQRRRYPFYARPGEALAGGSD